MKGTWAKWVLRKAGFEDPDIEAYYQHIEYKDFRRSEEEVLVCYDRALEFQRRLS